MKNKYIIILLLVFSFALNTVSAQEKRGRFDIEKFKQEKAEFMKKEIGLSEEEAKLFIPVMNELMDKKFTVNRAARKEARELRRKENKSEADFKRLSEVNLGINTKELELDREYLKKFEKIISSEKIYKYQDAEAKLMRQMLEKHNERHNSSKK